MGQRPDDGYSVLLSAARSLMRAADIPALIDSILVRAKAVVGAEACSIILPDAATGDLVIHSAQGNAAPVLGATRIPKGAGIAGKAFMEKRTINLSDLASNRDHYKGVDQQTGFITRSMLTVPLLKGDEALGVLQMLNPEGRDKFGPEDEALVEGLATLIVTALTRLEEQKRLVREAREQEELRLAEEIQAAFLPPPSLGFEQALIETFSQSAKQVGGDFSFAFPTPGGGVLVGLGDVAGKGIPASLTMARTTAKIEALAPLVGDDLGTWVGRLNESLTGHLIAGRFIAATFLLANPEKGMVQVVTAGQFGPLVGDASGWEEPEVPSQLPLGVFGGFSYVAKTFPLQPGQNWLLYSDGIAEARNVRGEELGRGGVRSSLPKNLSVPGTMDAAIEVWRTFTEGAPQHDDASILLLHWRGPSPPEELRMECETAKLCRGREFVEAWAHYAGYDDLTVGQIVLACDEAATNVHRYAYGHQPGPLGLRARIEGEQLVFILEDEGVPCDPAKIKGRELSDLRPGGLGSFILGATFQTVDYQPREKGTVLTLKKDLPRRRQSAC
ncbi:MAG: SpoIIE family protein phosphatase [Verrucomicrobiia bacterium]